MSILKNRAKANWISLSLWTVLTSLYLFSVRYSSDVSENSRVEDRVTDKPGSHSHQVGSPLCSVSEQFSLKLVTEKYQRRQTLSKKAVLRLQNLVGDLIRKLKLRPRKKLAKHIGTVLLFLSFLLDYLITLTGLSILGVYSNFVVSEWWFL